jgi:thiol:disulfide interchange protein DsbD
MEKMFFAITLAFGLTGVAPAQAGASERPNPFVVTGVAVNTNGVSRVVFHFEVPPRHILYADRLAFESGDGRSITPTRIPAPVLHRHEITGAERMGYDHSFSAEVELDLAAPVDLLVKFQGCSNSACYFPERRLFTVTSNGLVAHEAPIQVAAATAGATPGGLPDTNGFTVVSRETGYMAKSAFVAFLERARAGGIVAADALTRLKNAGSLATVLVILVGGIGLNLTPCVLPLIPINLALIGAGAQAGSRGRGFALGSAYGLGMALVYGVLGLVVVLTGAKFGTLNSSPWFNLGIALVFLGMGLAMFDLVNVDFSRFQGRTASSTGSKNGKFALALGMGAMAALLAGACVAPVVISVLLLATNLYGTGMIAGLLLPFLLGLGMALPWPFAGAGLSFLPKPGKWMKWVKVSFGILILSFGGYYGYLGSKLLRADSIMVSARSFSPEVAPEAALSTALEQARAQGRPVLVDFAASWCKDCAAMDAAVFPAAEVRNELTNFVFVRYQADKPNESPAREILDRFGVMGLPTYVVLKPDPKERRSNSPQP